MHNTACSNTGDFLSKPQGWVRSYRRAIRAKPHLFLSASIAAKDEIQGRMADVRLSREEGDILEYSELILALMDLNVLATAFWKYSQVPAME